MPFLPGLNSHYLPPSRTVPVGSVSKPPGLGVKLAAVLGSSLAQQQIRSYRLTQAEKIGQGELSFKKLSRRVCRVIGVSVETDPVRVGNPRARNLLHRLHCLAAKFESSDQYDIEAERLELQLRRNEVVGRCMGERPEYAHEKEWNRLKDLLVQIAQQHPFNASDEVVEDFIKHFLPPVGEGVLLWMKKQLGSVSAIGGGVAQELDARLSAAFKPVIAACAEQAQRYLRRDWFFASPVDLSFNSSTLLMRQTFIEGVRASRATLVSVSDAKNTARDIEEACKKLEVELAKLTHKDLSRLHASKVQYVLLKTLGHDLSFLPSHAEQSASRTSSSPIDSADGRSREGAPEFNSALTDSSVPWSVEDVVAEEPDDEPGTPPTKSIHIQDAWRQARIDEDEMQ